MIRNLPEKTGRTLDQWVAIAKSNGPAAGKERRQWLKDQHGLSTLYAAIVAERSVGKGEIEDYDPCALVDAMFAGPKVGLRPIYDKLIETGFSMGADVKVRPAKTIVPFYRKHVFAQIKPSTRTRINMRFALKGARITGKRLVQTGGAAADDRITHAIAITRLEEVDEEVRKWFRTAYERDE
jgi:hypothetical protein